MGKPRDLTDQSFGLWQVLRRVGRRNGSTYWLCRCRCGYETERSLANLLSCLPTSGCRECYIKRVEAETEIVPEIGSWTILGPAPSRNGRVWRCRCRCGQVRDIPGKTLRYGTSTKCIRCSGDQKHKRTGVVPQWVVTNARRSAAARQLVFEVTPAYLDELFRLQGGICPLTGLELTFSVAKNKTALTTASVDRIDNNLGYVVGNVRWIHKVVNRMRSSYDDETFVHWCRLVVAQADTVQTNPTAIGTT